MASIHAKKPQRRQIANRPVYTAYRQELRQDFNGCCGYCDDADERLDRTLFHIDHFAPKKKFPALNTTYSNLVYACRFCNVCKSNHWVGHDPAVSHDGEAGFIDPCSIDYDDHLERENSGRIVAKTKLGSYIIRRLKLNLTRHELLWNARRNRALRAEVQGLYVRLKAAGAVGGDPQLVALAESFMALTTAIDAYELSSVSP